MERTRVNISFLWLFVVAILGCVLRIYPVSNIPVAYKNILHAHSHVAFLGWIFTSLFTLISISFLRGDSTRKGRFNLQFIIIQVAVTGMLFAFLCQGYGPISIFFSALHMVASTWFAITVFKTCKSGDSEVKPISVKFLFAALSFMILSSIGPLSLPVITRLSGAGSPLYSNAIYFYLHFQYNGWFIFALFALIFKKLEEKGIEYSIKNAGHFFHLMMLSCVLSFFLSVLWSQPGTMIWILAGSGAILQVIALLILYLLLSRIKLNRGGILKPLVYCIMFAFSAKIALQLLSAFPLFAEMASSIRHFVIAYIHLVVLGVVTFSIFAYFLEYGFLIASKKITKTGVTLFIAGFIVSEAVAVIQGIANLSGTSLKYYPYLQIAAAAMILSGLALTYTGRNKPIKLKIRHINFNTINSINLINNSKLQS